MRSIEISVYVVRTVRGIQKFKGFLAVGLSIDLRAYQIVWGGYLAFLGSIKHICLLSIQTVDSVSAVHARGFVILLGVRL